MTSSTALPRNLIIFGLILPLAALMGFLLATPENIQSLALIGTVVLVLISPILLRWHHPLLVVSWNMAINVFFLPGQPLLWMLLAISSLTISFLNWLLTKQKSFLHVPELTWSLIALACVTIVTAKITGGIGIRALGGDTYGGKQYVLIIVAIIGFFALVSKQIDGTKGNLMAGLLFVSGITPIVSNLAYFGGPSFYFLYWVFPVGYAGQQAIADWSLGGGLSRLGGFSAAGMAVMAFLMVRYGLRGLLQPSKPWRWIAFFGLFLLTLLGGFRGSVVLIGLLLFSLFWLEHLYRTRIVIAVILVCVLGGAFLMAFSTRLPLSMQRSLSILPFEVSPVARYDAEATTEWRLKMWRYLLPEVPKHLWKPKGYALDPTELYMINEGVRRGIGDDIDMAIASGTYHSGPLTLVLGLGIWGVLAFGAFAASALRVLYRNYRYGPPALSTANTFLLAYFATRLIYFIVVFGHFAEDLFIFTGVVGLSISINGGMRKPAEERIQATEPSLGQLQSIPV
jgi:hypothetical protein